MPLTEAQKKANRKYDQAHYKAISCKCKLSDYEIFKQYANNNNINSMSNFLYKAAKYCIDNNIKL